LVESDRIAPLNAPTTWVASSCLYGGGDGQGACGLRLEFRPTASGSRFLQQSFDHLDHRFARFGHRDDALAVTHEDLDPSSFSSSRICLDTPGWEVKSFLAASVRFSLA